MNKHLQPPSGQFDGPRHLFPVRVYYEDTDLSGMVYHANYLKFCERARTELLRLLGIHQGEAVNAGKGNYAVAEANLRYFAPARLDDALIVETTAVELRAASVRLRQRVMRGADMLAELAIRVGYVSPHGRPRRQPDAWRAAFDNFFAKDSE